MKKIKSDQLQELLLQAKYASDKQRLEQIKACEELMRLIQPGQFYPFEFVCYHLTGFRRHDGREFENCPPLSYEDLLKALPVYSTELSRTMQIPSGFYEGKFLTVESLTKRFRVSDKTIRRWTNNGLIGRYLLFPDGRTRLSFTEEAVELFVERNQNRVRRGHHFSKVDDDQKQAIITRLSKWASRCPDHRQEAIRRTARRFHRAEETIRTLLSQLEHTQDPMIEFNRRAWTMDVDQQEEISQLYRQGMSVTELMDRFGRSRSNIYHAINREQADKLLQEEIFYIHSPEFDNPANKNNILKPTADLFPQVTDVALTENSKSDHENSLETIKLYIDDVSRTELLNAKQEFFLFRQFNYLKYKASLIQQQIDRNFPSARMIHKMRLCQRQAQEIKNWLIRSNLRLVISVARKHTRNETEMNEYISEGNITLMNAIEKFDFTRGNKLSTYATWAIVKRFATLKTKSAKQIAAATLSEETFQVAEDLRVEESRVVALETARNNLEEVMISNLEERECVIVREHYGLIRQTEVSGQRSKGKSLRQIAESMGLSKERVRQIELFALQKLRKVLSPEQFEVLIQA